MACKTARDDWAHRMHRVCCTNRRKHLEQNDFHSEWKKIENRVEKNWRKGYEGYTQMLMVTYLQINTPNGFVTFIRFNVRVNPYGDE